MTEFTRTRRRDRADEKVCARGDLQLPLSAGEHHCTRTGVCPQLLLQRRWIQTVGHYQQVNLKIRIATVEFEFLISNLKLICISQICEANGQLLLSNQQRRPKRH